MTDEEALIPIAYIMTGDIEAIEKLPGFTSIACYGTLRPLPGEIGALIETQEVSRKPVAGTPFEVRVSLSGKGLVRFIAQDVSHHLHRAVDLLVAQWIQEEMADAYPGKSLATTSIMELMEYSHRKTMQ